MAQEKLTEESNAVLDAVNECSNFLLSGGAGSGKTFSLVEIASALLERNPSSNITCITYTNTAADEISNRVNHENLYVSTIHEFLWNSIKSFQNEIKATLVELINDEEQKRFSIPDNDSVEDDFYNGIPGSIEYKEFVRLNEGVISHDELIILSNRMYEKYPKLCSITKDRHPFILIDEYQDTDRLIVDIFLNHLNASRKRHIVGFIGDSMQSIYPDGIGDLDEYLGDNLREIQKQQNRRNPQKVIDLANRLRNDNLEQLPSDDPLAPNMIDGKVKEGDIKFIYSESDDLDRLREYLGWNFKETSRCKELNLTHNLIASKAGFPDLMRIYDGDRILEYVSRIKRFINKNPGCIVAEGLTFEEVVTALQHNKSGKELTAVSPTKKMQDYMDQHPVEYEIALKTRYETISRIYVDKDQLVDDKKNEKNQQSKVSSQRDELISHLFKIQHCLRLYSENRISEFIRLTDFRIRSIKDKRKLKACIEELIESEELTVSQVVDIANDNGLVLIDDRLRRFVRRKEYIYFQVMGLPYSQFRKLYFYLEGFTPFSTQHKTKGDEFDNVLVIMDNGNWNNYNFDALFTGQGRDTVIERSKKIFYVCCTRAMDRLAVFYHAPSQEVLKTAIDWFGKESVVNLDNTQKNAVIFRSIDEPIRKNPDYDERWKGRDRGLITCWEVGRKNAKKNSLLAQKAMAGELPTLGWKGGAKENDSYGTLYYLAKWHGLRGEDLNIDLTKEITLTCTEKNTSVTYTFDSRKYLK
ncbi:MAG: UvrD-helicase domain-containing protein [Cellvibrionaceae bacterium]|nr:UvrD-helicase domain-containing protein [Cellvibrionaceae bacterium]